MVTKVITGSQFTISVHHRVTETQRKAKTLSFLCDAVVEMDLALADFLRQDRVVEALTAIIGHGLHKSQDERVGMVFARSQLRLK